MEISVKPKGMFNFLLKNSIMLEKKERKRYSVAIEGKRRPAQSAG